MLISECTRALLRIALAGVLCGALTSAARLAAAAEPATTPLPRRAPLTTSRFRGRPEPPPPFRPQRLFPQVHFDKPTAIAVAKGLERFFVAEQAGKIFSVPSGTGANSAEPQAADPFIDIRELLERQNRDRPEQLSLEAVYGLEFDPDFPTNKQVYVCYVVRNPKVSGQWEGGSRVSRFTVTGDPPTCDLTSEKLIISWLQGGHNGGCLKFGPDGCLYVSTGDGGFAFPPDGRKSGQDMTTLVGKILRIDVRREESGKAYAIPSDNPFVKLPAARGEIWAYGVRNPWKMSFDRATGALWVGDVGWELWELIYRVNKGDNYGWSIVEGRQSVHPDGARGPTPIVPPTIEIPHTDGASVTGGFVYRGKQFPELVGQYIFGDWETRRIWGVPVDAADLNDYREVVEPTVRIVDFAEDAAGELYLLDHDDGGIYALARNPPPAASEKFPAKLSETGLFRSVPKHEPAAGVVPFVVNVEQWSDHAQAERWLALPGDGGIRVHGAARPAPGSMFSRQMDYPLNSVLLKTLSLDMVQGDASTRRRIETQVLHFDGREWQGYTYRWNDAQTDAELVGRAGESAQFTVRDASAPSGVREQAWRFVSRSECIRCHNPWSEYALAFNLPQLNRRHDYGGDSINQITALRQLGVLDDLIDYDPANPTQALPLVPPEKLPALTPPKNAREDLNARARSYLHVNCGHCHRFNGGGASYIYLQHDLSLADTKLLGAKPTQGGFGIAEAEIVAAGDPFRSTLFYRLAKIGPGHMPRLGAEMIDSQGLHLLHDWIRQLPKLDDPAQKVARLAELDETVAAARETEDAARKAWRIAYRKAEAAGRETPSDVELQDAVKQVAGEMSSNRGKRKLERQKLLDELVASPAVAMPLAFAASQNRLPNGIKQQAVAAALASPDPAIRDLFEPFVPLAQRSKRLGETIIAADLLKLSGDVARGRALFHASNVVQCRSCHRIAGKGIELGPDLDSIGKKYDRAKLLESILEPSKQIDPKYQAYMVQTTAGKVLSGLLVKRDDAEIILKDPQNKTHRFATAEVEAILPQSKSLMPDGVFKEFTAEQAADLLAYLASLQAEPKKQL